MDKTPSVPTPVGCVFGPFAVDYVRQLAWRDGKPLALTGKSFEVLVYLIANRDRIVPKDDLLKEIWPDTFVQENNLVRHVSTLRKALGQRPEDHDYVLTVQGRGYRFVAPITELTVMPAELSRAPHEDGSGAQLIPVESPSLPFNAPSSATPESQSVPPTFHVAGRSPRLWVRVTVVCCTALLTFVVWTLRGPSTPTVEAKVVKPFTYGPGGHWTPAWAPDGQALAYAWDRDGNIDIYVRRLDVSDSTRLTTSPWADWQPAWSPNGEWVAFRSERDGGGLYVMPASGGSERRITTFGFEPRWSPDGQRILFNRSQFRRPRPRPFVVSLDGSEPIEVLSKVASSMQGPSFGWHPDGRVSVSGQVGDEWRFSTVALDGQGIVVSTESEELAAQRKALDLVPGRFVWAPDGRSVYFEGLSFGVRNLWRFSLHPETLAWYGSPERLTTGQGVDRGMAVSPDGRRLAFEASAERTRIWSFPIDPSTGAATDRGVPVTPGAAGEFDAAVSRDGRQLVYRTVRDRHQELWHHSFADGRERRLLADAFATRSTPRWSPDGTRLVYLVTAKTGDTSSGSRLAVLSPSGGGERFLQTPGNAAIIPDDWSADGRFVLGACPTEHPNRSAVCLVAIDGSQTVRLLASEPERSLHNARFSPDQQQISFTGHRPGTGHSTVYVRPLGGGAAIPITDGAAFEDKTRWAPDGRTIYFVSDRAGFLNVWGRRVAQATGHPEGPIFQVTRFDGLRQAFAGDLRTVDMAITPNRLFVPMTEASGQIWILEHVSP